MIVTFLKGLFPLRLLQGLVVERAMSPFVRIVKKTSFASNQQWLKEDVTGASVLTSELTFVKTAACQRFRKLLPNEEQSTF